MLRRIILMNSRFSKKRKEKTADEVFQYSAAFRFFDVEICLRRMYDDRLRRWTSPWWRARFSLKIVLKMHFEQQYLIQSNLIMINIHLFCVLRFFPKSVFAEAFIISDIAIDFSPLEIPSISWWNLEIGRTKLRRDVCITQPKYCRSSHPSNTVGCV